MQSSQSLACDLVIKEAKNLSKLGLTTNPSAYVYPFLHTGSLKLAPRTPLLPLLSPTTPATPFGDIIPR